MVRPAGGDGDGLPSGDRRRFDRRLRRTQENFELNAMRPIITNNVLHSAWILGGACEKPRRFSVEGAELDRKEVQGIRHLPQGGRRRHDAVGGGGRLGVSAEDFDRIVAPETMAGDPRRDLGLDN
jgi:hypothetical protein